jgi:hypothetical protein
VPKDVRNGFPGTTALDQCQQLSGSCRAYGFFRIAGKSRAINAAGGLQQNLGIQARRIALPSQRLACPVQ